MCCFAAYGGGEKRPSVHSCYPSGAGAGAAAAAAAAAASTLFCAVFDGFPSASKLLRLPVLIIAQRSPIVLGKHYNLAAREDFGHACPERAKRGGGREEGRKGGGKGKDTGKGKSKRFFKGTGMSSWEDCPDDEANIVEEWRA